MTVSSAILIQKGRSRKERCRTEEERIGVVAKSGTNGSTAKKV